MGSIGRSKQTGWINASSSENWRRIWRRLDLCLVLGLMVMACSPDDEQSRPERPDNIDIRPDVIFSAVDDEPLHIYIESQGIVEANQEVVIRPRVGGFVGTTRLEDGTFAVEGDTLLAFLDEEWRYQVRQARNEVASARVEYDIEKRHRTNSGGRRGTAGQQVESGAGTREEEDRMLRNITGLAQAELDLERAQMDLSYAVIRAPFSGFLSVPERVSHGAYIGSGQELGRLIDDRTVLVRLDVLESELNRLEPGMPAQITSPEGERLEGQIRSMSPVVDPDRKTGQVLVEVENRDRVLKVGMTVEGRVQIASHSGIVRIPRSAILERDGGRTLVFRLMNGGEQVEWIYVEPEYMTSEWAIINHEEIVPGDTLAVDQHFALSHLQYVRPRMTGDIASSDLEQN